MSPKILLSSIINTCECCPAQWDAKLMDGRPVYIRLRHNRFTISCALSARDAYDKFDAQETLIVSSSPFRCSDIGGGAMWTCELIQILKFLDLLEVDNVPEEFRIRGFELYKDFGKINISDEHNSS